MTTTKRVRTVRDAMLENMLAEAALGIGDTLGPVLQAPLDPRIGELCRNGKPLFYAYVGGVYREGSRLHVAALLYQHDNR